MNLSRKTIPLEVKDLKDWSFTGWASVYGNEDLGGDVVMPGAFDKSLSDRNRLTILWQHKSDEPIGIGLFTSKEQGLQVEADLDPDDNTAKRARRKMKRGEVKGLSIDYSVPPGGAEFRKGVRYINEAKLWAVSVVTFPMNTQAQVTDVKSAPEQKADDFATTLEMIRMYNAHSQMLNALYATLDGCMWDYKMDSVERLAMIETSIDQFQTEYMGWANQFYATEKAARQEIAAIQMEVKAGRKISQASRSRIEKAIEELSALLAEETKIDDDAEKAADVSVGVAAFLAGFSQVATEVRDRIPVMQNQSNT